MSVIECLPVIGYQDNEVVKALLLPLQELNDDLDTVFLDPIPVIPANSPYYGQLLGYQGLITDFLTDTVKNAIGSSGLNSWVGTLKSMVELGAIIGVTVFGYTNIEGVTFLVIDEASVPPWSPLFAYFREKVIPYATPAWQSVKVCYDEFRADFSSANDPVEPTFTNY